MLRLVEAFALLTYRLAQISVIGTLVVVSFEVIARYLFNSPTQSSLEITEYFLVAMGFLPLAAIHRSGGHVSVEILTAFLSSSAQNVCRRIALLITALFSSVVSWFGFDLTYHALQTGTASSSLLSFPMWIVYLTIPLGFLALALEALRELVQGSTNEGVA